jgi:hypothetical protein
MPALWTFLRGWEGPAVSLAFFALAFWRESSTFGIAGALTSVPFCLFAGGYPILGEVARVALVGNLLAAGLMRRKRDMAFAALTPFGALCVFLVVLTLRGITLAHP